MSKIDAYKEELKALRFYLNVVAVFIIYLGYLSYTAFDGERSHPFIYFTTSGIVVLSILFAYITKQAYNKIDDLGKVEA